ncbi:MAG: META domain-containing protein [Pseudomonadota bacterium]
MKAMVGFLFFMLFMGCLAFVMMMGKDLAKTKANPEGALSRVAWQLSALGTQVEFASDLSLEIGNDSKLSGHAGCNAFSSEYTLLDGGIQIGPVRATRKACPETIMKTEAEFLRRLEAARSFKVGRYGLVLANGQEQELLRFKAIALQPATS